MTAKDGRELLYTVSGGTSYGTSLPGQGDLDFMKVTVMPMAHYLGLNGDGQVDSAQEFGATAAGTKTDVTYHEVTKFFRLLASGNPAVFPVLFQTDPNMVGARADRVWRDLVLFNQTYFLSKAPYHAFRGMALQELRKFVASVEMELPKPQRAWKSAMHSVRLMRMLVQYLETGTMTVCRVGVDHEYLWDVRQGNVEPAKVEGEVNELLALAEALMVTTTLPSRCDMGVLSNLLVDVKMAMWEAGV